ncbi:MAG: YHYH protein [Bacteroidetes bacterium]|nr:MAG: YHYH protein [Bacteroidota bacterium]REK05694.1 MAG: YHYH protein [Bacteroidota bacterium]REK32000.1 MAG: YHYH protein [Bacteroidota bacterium]REK50064.1 MAG: YHYH protein [Bacteroidota bacterium]
MNKTLTLLICCLLSINTFPQIGPEITSWIINNSGATGYNNIPSNVQLVQYSTNNVYVSATCIPSYNIGPWPGNPNTPVNQNFVYKITRNPVQNTGTPVNIGLGHIGVWINGVSIFNASDGQSYNNQGVWNRNAYYWEGPSFDNCLGHPAPNGEYHHHVSPACLYDEYDSLNHSPIIGYAFDGFPVYGAYAFENTNGTGQIKRIKSSYVLSTSTSRTNGPPVNSTYPAGCFMEDYVYTPGSGDLDNRNGRFCITPEYPLGTYAYFATLDAPMTPSFPYTFYGSYYGTVQAGNTGPNGGHNTISEPVTIHNPTGITEHSGFAEVKLYPNPAQDMIRLFIEPGHQNNIRLEVWDMLGKLFISQHNVQPGVQYDISLEKFNAGIYVLKLQSENSNSQFTFSVIN